MVSRILLADDSITIQKVVNRAFAEEGIEVVTVSSGDQAERQLADVNPNLVLADIFMPGKNGYELCESIKENPKFRHIPVVLLVGAFEPFDQAEARRVRADDHLTKPFEFRALIETVRRLIAATAQTQTGPLPPLPQTRTEEEPVAPLEPRPSAPLATPSFKIDLAAMSEPVSSPQMQAQDQASLTATALDESSPLDVDYADTETTMSFGVVNVEPAPESYAQQTTVFGSPSWVNEMAASPIQFGGYNEPAPPEPLDLGALDFSTSAHPAQPDADLEVETSSHPDDIWPPDPTAQQTSEDEGPPVVLDFEKSDMPQAHSGVGALVFEPEPEALFEVVTEQEQAQSTESAATGDFDDLKTQPLDSTTTEELESQWTPDSTAQLETAVSQGEATQESFDPGLFSVDNPLGDLLADDTAASASTNGSEAHSSTHQADMYRSGIGSGDAFELEFSPDDSKAQSETASMPVDRAPQSAGHDLSGEAAESDQQSILVTEDLSSVEPEQAAPAGFQETVSGFEIIETTDEHAPAESVYAGLADTDLSAGAEDLNEAATVENEPLDIQSMPAGEEVTGVAEAASFTSSTMWTEEETRFAPIDIEAVSVDEAAPESASAVAETERGFEIAQPAHQHPVESQPATVEAAETVEPQEVSEPTSQPEAQMVDLSPATIDKIVERVVAQMNDAVVREIAWEVVPDVVERIIERLTREELARRS